MFKSISAEALDEVLGGTAKKAAEPKTKPVMRCGNREAYSFEQALGACTFDSETQFNQWMYGTPNNPNGFFYQ